MSEFDQDIKVGDIITAYHKGYHRVVEVKRRFHNPNVPSYDRFYYSDVETPDHVEMNSLITYVKVLTDDFKVAPRKKAQCDASYCRIVHVEKLVAERDRRIKELTEGYDRLLDIVRV